MTIANPQNLGLNFFYVNYLSTFHIMPCTYRRCEFSLKYRLMNQARNPIESAPLCVGGDE